LTDDATGLDDDPGQDEDGPTRRCLATGARFSVDLMIRFALSPDGVATPDLGQELPGRGAWVRSSAEAFAQLPKGAFARAFKAPVQAPAGLAARVEGLLVQRLVSLVGLGRRAGEAFMGFAQVEEALLAGAIDGGCLLTASDSGPADRGKMLQIARRRDNPPFFSAQLTRVEIGLAFVRENVVHAALKRGGLAARFQAEATRLSGFRALAPGDWFPADGGRDGGAGP
jgi:predicted RNA-binding protein YlxR (DUF448 family)